MTLDSSTDSVPEPEKDAPAGTTQYSAVLVPALPVRTSIRLASIACLASPPDKYALELTARSPARFLRFSPDSALPTITSLASGSCCSREATSSRTALQVLSTRQGFTLLGNSHSLNLLASGGGGGGTSTVTCVDAGVARPRESVQVALTVMGPADAPVVLRVAVPPSPEMLPPLAVQVLTLTGTLSGLVQEQVMVAGVPACTEVGLAEQDMVGGFLGGSLTVKFAVQLASPPFFILGSTTRAVTT